MDLKTWYQMLLTHIVLKEVPSSQVGPVAMCAVQILFTLCSQPSPEYDVLCPVGYVRLLQSTFLSMYCLCCVDGFRNDRQSSDGR